MTIPDYDSERFESAGHEIVAGVAAGMLMKHLGGIPVTDADGRHTPYIDVPLPDAIPFPVRSIRLRIEAPLGDLSMQDFINSIQEYPDPTIRNVAEEAARKVWGPGWDHGGA